MPEGRLTEQLVITVSLLYSVLGPKARVRVTFANRTNERRRQNAKMIIYRSYITGWSMSMRTYVKPLKRMCHLTVWGEQ
jgi:hypothetical protein